MTFASSLTITRTRTTAVAAVAMFKTLHIVLLPLSLDLHEVLT